MKKHIKIFSLIIILIIADQLTKLWALADLRGSEGIPVISGVFELQYLENRGAAFGILQDKQILFLLITVAVAVLLTYIYIRIPKEIKYTTLRICYVLLMAYPLEKEMLSFWYVLFCFLCIFWLLTISPRK